MNRNTGSAGSKAEHARGVAVRVWRIAALACDTLTKKIDGGGISE